MSKKKIVIAILGIPVLLYVGLVIGYNLETSHKKAPGTATAQAAPPSQPPTRTELLQLVNAERAKYKAAPLQEDAALDQAAQAKAEDEVVHGYAHECPECLNGMLAAEKDLGLQGNYAENLMENTYAGTNTPDNNTSKGTVDAWVNSKPHFQTMIDPRYTFTGFGISGTQVVEEFYSPQKFTTSTTVNLN